MGEGEVEAGESSIENDRVSGGWGGLILSSHDAMTSGI